MNKYHLTLAVVGLAAVLSSAVAFAPGSTADAEWTIMIFLNGDNNLEAFGLEDFEEMAKVGSADKVNVIVQFDRSPNFSTDEGNWTQTLRFRVNKNMKPLPANAVEDIGEVNMGDGQVLADFVTWAKTKYPAKRYMLDIWDHGQGWRFFETTHLAAQPRDGSTSNREAQLEFRSRQMEKVPMILRTRGEFTLNPEADVRAIPEDRVVGATVRYISSDSSSNDHLFNREIQDSLQLALLDEKLDVIGFDACLMGMVETAYAMRDIAEVMVGSEELEPGAGWNYELFLKKVVDNPTMNAEELGRALVDTYKSTYTGHDESTTLSAVRLSGIRRLSAAVSRFANSCQAGLANEAAMLRTARDACENYAPGYGLNGIDLDRFCEQVATATNDASLRDRAKAVRTELAAMVIQNYAGTDRQGKYGSKGLAIYFPARKTQFDYDPDKDGYLESNTNYPVQFVQYHRWDNFLHPFLILSP
jgi:Clostripain family